MINLTSTTLQPRVAQFRRARSFGLDSLTGYVFMPCVRFIGMSCNLQVPECRNLYEVQ
jgi:hypothetical protein